MNRRTFVTGLAAIMVVGPAKAGRLVTVRRDWPQVVRVFDRVKAAYQPERDREDRWTSYAKEVRRGLAFAGDCDDFAMTCAELLLEEGLDPWLVICRTPRLMGGEMHMVCLVEELVLDNLLPVVQPLAGVSAMGYRWGERFKFDQHINRYKWLFLQEPTKAQP